MKKILCLTLVVLMLCVYTVSAKDVAVVSEGRMMVSGFTENPAKRASLVVYNQSVGGQVEKDNIVQIEQAKVVNGEYNFDFPFGYEGELSDYVALLNVGGVATTLSVEEAKYRYDDNFVLFRVDDAVKPDNTFNVYGHGLNRQGICFYVSRINDVQDLDSVTDSEKIELTKVNVDQDGVYAQLILPENISSGSFNLWATCDRLITNVICVNKARPQWINENVINAGNEVLISGRNLSAAEWNANSETQVKLKSTNGDEYFATVMSVNPFAVKFTVEDTVPLGEYDLYVANDGILWSPLENGDKITIVSSPDDPYDLNVAWAGQFNTSNVINVEKYFASGNDTYDDTRFLQAAIDKAAQTGGVVYLPNGSYYFEKLDFKDNVIIQGESKENTFLIYRPSTNDGTSVANKKNAISSSATEGKQGIVNITLSFDSELSNDYLPLNLLCMGNETNQHNADLRTASYGFMKNVNITYSKDVPENKSIGRIYIGYKDHFIVDGCRFVGHNANITSSYIGKYLNVTNNIVDTNVGGFYIYSQYSVYENNHFTRLPNNAADETNYGTQGIYTRSESYIANNTIINTGNKGGDGEILAAEEYRGGTKMYGDVLSVNGNEVFISPQKNLMGAVVGGNYASGMWAWDFSRKCSGDWYIVIVDGKGTGQYKKIVSADEESEKLIVDGNWEIPPDITSKFAVVMPLKNITYYNNDVSNCRWAMLFYGPTLDCVVADNNLVDSGGIQIQVIQKTKYSDTEDYDTETESETLDCRKNMAYFNRICRNSLEGTSWVGLTSEITVITKIEYVEVFGVPVIGISISDNEIEGDGKSPDTIFSERSPDFGYGQFFRNGINVAMLVHRVKPVNPTVEAVIIENNTLSNVYDGITIGGGGYLKDIDEEYMATLCGTTAENMSIRKNTFYKVVRKYTEYSENEKLNEWEITPTEITLNKNDASSLSFSLKNNQNKLVEGKLIIAEYFDNYSLKNTDIRDVIIQGVDANDYTVELNENSDIGYLGIFFWNSLDELKPITESKKINIIKEN